MRMANNWNIPEWLEKEVRERDTSCVYCGTAFTPAKVAKKHAASWEHIINDENIITTEHRDKMLDNRNKNWIPKIIEFAKEQRVFFGVGAGHLPGENGVINLLRKEGYTVKAVM